MTYAGKAVACLSLVLACGEPSPSRGAEQAALGGEIAARVGQEAIPLALVGQVAVEQGISAGDAAKRLVDDAVAASSARTRGLHGRQPASWRMRAAAARFFADRFRAAAVAAGPPSDEEVRQLSERHWQQVDRPAAVRVIHALAMRPAKADATLEASARDVAARLRESVVNATSPEDFRTKASAVPHPAEIEVRIETLPAFVVDGSGRFIDGRASVVQAFANGASSLSTVGETSAIIETQFGWHVVRLIERLPEQRMAFETRRVAFAEEAYSARAHAATKDVLGPLRQKTAIEILPSAEALMRNYHPASDATPASSP